MNALEYDKLIKIRILMSRLPDILFFEKDRQTVKERGGRESENKQQ